VFVIAVRNLFVGRRQHPNRDVTMPVASLPISTHSQQPLTLANISTSSPRLSLISAYDFGIVESGRLYTPVESATGVS
jgi:hypothetical protein